MYTDGKRSISVFPSYIFPRVTALMSFFIILRAPFGKTVGSFVLSKESLTPVVSEGAVVFANEERSAFPLLYITKISAATAKTEMTVTIIFILFPPLFFRGFIYGRISFVGKLPFIKTTSANKYLY